jgi:hypothetical protein
LEIASSGMAASIVMNGVGPVHVAAMVNYRIT